MLEDILAFAALPLAAAVIFTGIHTWLGLQVLRRNVVFADLGAGAGVSARGDRGGGRGTCDFEPGRIRLHADLCRWCRPPADRESQPRPQRAAGSLHRRALRRRHCRDRARRRPFAAGSRARQEDAGRRHPVGDGGRRREIRRALRRHRRIPLVYPAALAGGGGCFQCRGADREAEPPFGTSSSIFHSA